LDECGKEIFNAEGTEGAEEKKEEEAEIRKL
jgi:hypothetical protein